MDIIFILWRVSFFLEKYPNIYFLIEIYGDDLCMCLLAWFNYRFN